jgi:diguanylate cyclase (GGDEF)-like protein
MARHDMRSHARTPIDDPGERAGLPAVSMAMTQSAERIARLAAVLEAAANVRDDDDVERVLEAIAGTVAGALGLATVVVNVYRPAWDDFVVSAVFGSDDIRSALLGSTYARVWWDEVLDDRFLRRGAYVVNHGQMDWDTQQGARYVPSREASGSAEAWHPEDELFVPFRAADGTLLGIFSVGDPLSGRRLSDGELDVLVAVASQAAIAVQGARERVAAARHRRALEELLGISRRLSKSRDPETVLSSICDGVAAALDFAKVAIELADPHTGVLVPRAASGWRVDDPAIRVPFTMEQASRLLDPRFEREGCYLVPMDVVASQLQLPPTLYRSVMNGQGSHAWNHHFLLVPIHDGQGDAVGILVVTEPTDRLLPTADRLQALRLFANQASTALELAGQFAEIERLVEHDPLTHLLNRRTVIGRVERELARCAAGGLPLALLYCDVDGFKQLNDASGHACGDRALVRLGEVLTRAAGASGLAFRVGGDEFALLLPECRAVEAGRVVERIAAELAVEALDCPPLGVSFGVACADEAGSADSLLGLADERMYAAKRQRRLGRAA